MRFYFDYISPYAYLAWRRLPAIAARHGEAIVPVPVVFGALLSAHGTKGPAEVPAKRRYVLKDVYRKARLAGVPFMLPPAHPFNPLLALRASSLALADDAQHRLIDAVFAAIWQVGEGIETPGAVSRLAAAVGLDGDAIERAAAEPDAKARLRAQTDEAIAAGVFGVPTIAVDGELFWGVDALDLLDAYLEHREPVPAELVARWEALPASIQRRM
ncbi:MAG: 2-hydroxychromene-2-carboxylate isomerase [Deltaproteobacteria bacterium]|nr:MAG: 2-hydroxychromene-2-carboxylate isomerase [Deltaproteobacteria bacterium]